MTFILDMIKGIFIGIANIIPGVSGGTMAVSLGIYDKLISSVSGILKNWKKSLAALLPILLGAAAGIAGFTYAVGYLLSRHTFLTCMAFVGLILGGIPVLVRSLKSELKQSEKPVGFAGVFFFLLLFAAAIMLPMMNPAAETMKTFSPDPVTLLLLFLVGMIASATMVIPGVSGSLVLMILGFYYGVLGAVRNFLEALKSWDVPGLTSGLLLLVPFGIGVLLGIFLIAKLITFLFEKYGAITYCAILGLIAASPYAIFYNTGLFGQLRALMPGTFAAGILLAAAGAVLTFFLGETSRENT